MKLNYIAPEAIETNQDTVLIFYIVSYLISHYQDDMPNCFLAIYDYLYLRLVIL